MHCYVGQRYDGTSSSDFGYVWLCLVHERAGEQPEEPPKPPKFVSIQLKLFFEASFAYDFNLEFA